MTESASDPARDDVLSSIRKLVSATPVAAPAPDGDASADRLLLTPALRVEDPSGDDRAVEKPTPRILTLEDRIAELEAAVGSQSQEWEPDGSEGIESHRPDSMIYSAVKSETADMSADSNETPADDATVSEGAVQEAAFVHATDDLSETGDEAADIETSALFRSRREEDASAPDQADVLTLTNVVEEPDANTLASDPTAIETSEDVALSDTVGQPSVEEIPLVETTDSASIEAGVKSSDSAAEEAPSEDLSEADSIAAEPADEASNVIDLSDAQAPLPDVVEDDVKAVADQESGLADADVDTSTLELTEEKLREIVRDVLLDELSHGLGEKMTRNIRRMVRQEVERTLSLRDFD